MHIKHSFDDRFITLIDSLRKKYTDEMLELAGIGIDTLDINKFSKKFFKAENDAATADLTIDSNANVNEKTVFSWETELKKPLMKLNNYYVLWKSAVKKHGIKRANKIVENDINGAIRIHDFSGGSYLIPYCWAGSLSKLCTDGMPFYSKIKINKPKHFRSYMNLSLQYICYISNQIAGAIALPDFFVYMDYYVRKDFGEDWQSNERVVTEIKQEFQSWIYSVNFPWRSNQSPFTNLSLFDEHWLNALFEHHINPDHSKPNLKNVTVLQQIFANTMKEQLEDNPFTFPVMTACILSDKETGAGRDQKFMDYICKINSENGMFNIFTDYEVSALSSCCRLRNNLDSKNEYMNSFGAGGLDIGSHRVVTLNLARLAYEHKDKETFMKVLKHRIELSQDILDLHREQLIKLINDGKLPMYTHGFMNLKKQFSTLGFGALYECMELLGYDMVNEDGKELAGEILGMFNKLNASRTAKDGNIRNVEGTPLESGAVNFAKKDKLLYSEANQYEIYSNQYIPLVKNVDIVERIKAQGRFDRTVQGGSILHINMHDTLTPKQMKKLIEYAAQQGVIYFAINYGFSQCTSCDKVYIGKYDVSPCHKAKTKKYIRVVGFLTPVEDWSSERKEEYKERQFYKELKV